MRNSLQKIVFALFAVWALSCSAYDEYAQRIVTPLSLGFTSSLQYPQNNEVFVYGLRAGVWMNGLADDSSDILTEVYGLSIGLLAMHDEVVNGIQLSSLYNTTRTLNGLQAACLLNLSGEVNGVQMAFVNFSLGEMSGIQLGICNGVLWGDVSGIQLGVLNSGKDVYGIQAGLVNVAETDYKNRGIVVGSQIGLANIAKGDVRGVQIGLYNQASTLKGVQIGLLNHHGDRYFPLLMVGW